MSGDAIVVVAPRRRRLLASRRTSTRFGRSCCRATRVCICTAAPGTGARIRWAPTSVRIFNVQGRGYADDNGIAWLTRDHGVVFEVAAQV